MAVKRKSVAAVTVNNEKINESYKTFSQEVPLPGLYEIATSKHWVLKLVWGVSFTVFLGLTAFFIYRVVQDFLEEPIITKVSFVKKDKYYFPPVFVCFKNWNSDEHLLQMNLSSEGLYYMKRLFADTAIPDEMRNDTTRFLNGKRDFDEFYIKHNYKRMIDPLFDWSWNLTEISIWSIENIQVQMIYVLQLRQICFNVTLPSLKSSQAKKRSMKPSIYITTPDVSNESFNMFVGYDPRIVSNEDLTPLKAGYTYDVIIGTTNTISLPTRMNPCKGDDEVAKENYNEDYCQYYCEDSTAWYADFCTYIINDTEPLLDDEKALKLLCTINETTTEIDYLNFTSTSTNTTSTLYNETEDDVKDVTKSCEDNCPSVCSSLSYDVQVAVTATSDGEDNITTLNFRLLDGKNGILTYREVEAYTFVSAVSNVGGQLGLWLGFSVVTFLQVTLYWFKDCDIRKRKRVRVYDGDGNEVKC